MEKKELYYEMLPVSQLVLLPCHEVSGDCCLFYKGYSRRKAWFARIAAAKSGAIVVTHLMDGVEVARSYRMDWFYSWHQPLNWV